MANAAWSEKMLVLLRGMNGFHLPGSCRARCLRFTVAGQQVGWIAPRVASILAAHPQVFEPRHGGAISLRSNLGLYACRSEAVDTVLRTLRDTGSLSCLEAWRDEKCDVMARFCDAPLMGVERAAMGLFGVKKYGVHINGYSRSDTGELWMWLARRSATKQTYPGRLDNLAAGCLAAGMSVKGTLVKECEEEACIPADIAKLARPVSTVSYTYEDEEGVCPESQFVFDLELPPEFKPRIGDGEVQEFYLLPINEVKELLVSEEFKPNCALVVLDFLIRHSFIEPDTEPFYQQFVEALHQAV